MLQLASWQICITNSECWRLVPLQIRSCTNYSNKNLIKFVRYIVKTKDLTDTFFYVWVPSCMGTTTQGKSFKKEKKSLAIWNILLIAKLDKNRFKKQLNVVLFWQFESKILLTGSIWNLSDKLFRERINCSYYVPVQILFYSYCVIMHIAVVINYPILLHSRQ